MKKIFQNIISIVLISAILVSFVGIDVHHHICRMMGIHTIGFFEVTSNQTGTMSKEGCGSCSNGNEKNNYSCFVLGALDKTSAVQINNNCCEDYIVRKAIDSPYLVLKNISNLLSFQPIIFRLSENVFVSHDDLLQLNIVKKILLKNKSPIKFIIQFIHTTSHKDFPEDSPEGSID